MRVSARATAPTLCFYLVAIGAFVVDQVIKASMSATHALGATTPVVAGYFHLTYALNNGAAFSLFAGHVKGLALIALVVSLAIALYQWRKQPRSPLAVMALGLILGGALGNLYDRLAFGVVRDMLDVRWQGQNIWPIFNLADVFLITGVSLWVLWSSRQAEQPAACAEAA